MSAALSMARTRQRTGWSRFGGRLKVRIACNALTRRSLAPNMVAH